MRILVDVDELRRYATENLSYEDGRLFWKRKANNFCNNITIGGEAGSDSPSGYRNIRLKGRLYRTHRIIFLMHHNYLPKFIDHKDGDKLNNRIGNLRDASRSLNGINRNQQNNNSSGYKGVSWHNRIKKWQAYISINGKREHLGYFEIKEEAAHKYNERATEFFGDEILLNEVNYENTL